MSALSKVFLAVGYVGCKLNPRFKPPEKEYLRFKAPPKRERDRSYRTRDSRVPHLTLRNVRVEADDLNRRIDEVLSRSDVEFHSARTWDELRGLYREADRLMEDIASGAQY